MGFLKLGTPSPVPQPCTPTAPASSTCPVRSPVPSGAALSPTGMHSCIPSTNRFAASAGWIRYPACPQGAHSTTRGNQPLFCQGLPVRARGQDWGRGHNRGCALQAGAGTQITGPYGLRLWEEGDGMQQCVQWVPGADGRILFLRPCFMGLCLPCSWIPSHWMKVYPSVSLPLCSRDLFLLGVLILPPSSNPPGIIGPILCLLHSQGWQSGLMITIVSFWLQFFSTLQHKPLLKIDPFPPRLPFLKSCFCIDFIPAASFQVNPSTVPLLTQFSFKENRSSSMLKKSYWSF